MASYAVRYFKGDRRYKPVAIDDAQAEAMALRGEPMIYSEHRRAWAVARSLNRHEHLSDEGFAVYDSAEDN